MKAVRVDLNSKLLGRNTKSTSWNPVELKGTAELGIILSYLINTGETCYIS